jgi:steroid delta-isomerase-like uncharacterized protein
MADLQKAALATAAVALNEHNAAKLASCYAEDAVIHVAGLNDVMGRDAIAMNTQEWFETFSNVRLGFRRVWIQNDVVILEWVLNGTYTGDLFGAKGKEQPIGHLGLSVLGFDSDGHVKEEHRYGDLGAVYAQVTKKNAPPPPPIPPSAEMFASNGSPDEVARVELAKGLYAAIQAKSEPDFLSKLADDVEYEGHLGNVKGKAEGKKFFQSLTKAFPDIQLDVEGAYSAGDYAIVAYTLTGTNKGPILGIPASNRRVRIHAVDVVKIADGKVTRAQTYSNGLELMTQLGAMAPVVPPK